MQTLICNQGGHRGPSYPILVWDLEKGFKTIGAKHSFHPTYLAHVDIGFINI